MEFNKISAPSLKELFISEIESMILSGKLPIGSKLPSERDLAQSMQVSRAVINAGVSELERKGFLTIRPRVGTFVSDYRKEGTLETLVSIMKYHGGILREEEVRSILELRLALDRLAIHLAIYKMSDHDIAHLRTIAESFRETEFVEIASERAFQFQHELAMLSGNTLLPLLFSSFKGPVLALWNRYCTLHGIDILWKNTISLVECLEARDEKKAIDSLTITIDDAIRGSHKIYY